MEDEDVMSAEEALDEMQANEDLEVLPPEDADLSEAELVIAAMAGDTVGGWWKCFLIVQPLSDVPGHPGTFFLGIAPGENKPAAVRAALRRWPQYQGRMRVRQIPRRT